MDKKQVIGYNPFDNSYIKQMYCKPETNYWQSVGIMLLLGFIGFSMIKIIMGNNNG
jgi:hypothetical protein